MSRSWLLTWTTYGTWLPGDERGSVTSVREGGGPRAEHDQPGTEYDGPMPGLRALAESLMRGPPVALTAAQGAAVLAQFRETAHFRGWDLRGATVMWNHVHIVVRVPGDPDPSLLVKDFKGYASRALNRGWDRPATGWWADGGGSKRKLPDDQAVVAAIGYLRGQHQPLAAWIADDVEDGLGGMSIPTSLDNSVGPASRGT